MRGKTKQKKRIIYNKLTVDVSLLKPNPNDLLLFIGGRSSSVRLRVHGRNTHDGSNQNRREISHVQGRILHLALTFPVGAASPPDSDVCNLLHRKLERHWWLISHSSSFSLASPDVSDIRARLRQVRPELPSSFLWLQHESAAQLCLWWRLDCSWSTHQNRPDKSKW